MKLWQEESPRHPRRRPEVLAAAMAALEQGEWARLEGAPETEEALREFHGGGEVWFVASGTAALEAILLGHGIGFGDEVLTTPYTWGATVSAILAVGAVPVFADIDRETGLLDPASLEGKVTSRTKAVLAVHLYGWPCDMTTLREWTRAHGLLLFEDGSQAHGARWEGRRVGTLGDAAAFSCMGLKPLGGTEGGYAVFQNPRAAERAYLHGKHPRGLSATRAAALQAEGLLDSLQLGWRPCAVSAALVRANLPFLEEENAARRRNACWLREALAGQNTIRLAPEPPAGEPVYHLLSLVYEPSGGQPERAQFLARLAERGVAAFVYIPIPLHRLRRLDWRDPGVPPTFWHQQLRAAGVDYRAVDCPGAEWRADHTFEMVWNWTEDRPAAMARLAEILREAAD